MNIQTHTGGSSDKKRLSTYLRTAKAYGTKIERIVTERDYSVPESSLAILTDAKYQKNIKTKISHLMDAEHIVLIGIGGSSLGTEAVYAALKHTTTKQLTILDTLDEVALADCIRMVRSAGRLESLAVVVVTKSGNTAETLMNATAVLGAGEEVFGDSFTSRVVFVGNADTTFMKAGKRKKVLCITIPDAIGGRYSVFTAVGLVPLTLLGIDTDALIYGARTVVMQAETRTVAYAQAATIATLLDEGVSALNFFALDARLEKVGMWYRQLLAESIGKRETKKRQPFMHQLLPFVSTPADFHSVLQLYLSGYSHVYTYFISTISLPPETVTTTDHWLISHEAYLVKNSRERIMDALIHGVTRSYEESSLKYSLIDFDGMTPYELGAYMASAMLEVMVLCHLMGVNAFDQPEVEHYKKYAREILAS